jgi:DNA polymerase I
MPQKLFLLDAFALIYRAYFALARNPRITSGGKNTNAQFGFTNTLLDLLNKEKPSHLAVCFDSKAKTERHTDFEDYKANRQEAPEDLVLAIPDIKKIIDGFNIPVIEVPGYEADDIVGTLAKMAEKEGFEVYMVTPDKDYGQLVSEKIFIWKPPAFGNPVQIMGPKEVCEKWDIERVDQVIDLLGLMGDASDNIPGIPGVGEKTAVKFLKEYGTLENTLANAQHIKGKIGEKVAAGYDNAMMSKKLATIILNVPVTFDAEACKMGDPNVDLLNDIFNELEFKTLGKRILGDAYKGGTTTVAPGTQTDLFGNATETIGNATQLAEEDAEPIIYNTINDVPHNYILANDNDTIAQLIATLNTANEICFDTETTGTDANAAEIVGMSFSTAMGTGYYVPLNADNKKERLLQFEHLFNDASKIWIGHNIKYDLLILKWCGYELKGTIQDTMLAHYVTEPDGRRSMDVLAENYLNYKPVSITELIGPKGKGQTTMEKIDIEKVSDYAAEDADITLQLHQLFKKNIAEKEVSKLYNTIECPLVQVLTDMEFEGISVDKNFLDDYSKVLETDAKIVEEKVYEEAGVRFNLASPKQLGEVLFDKLQLDPKAKKTKTGQYATGEDVLQKLAVTHKIADDIMAFREYTKLKNTYVDALPLLINEKTNRVHTSYNQAVAVTGRLSSNEPNLQNIPIRTERGREIRKAFVPRDENFVILSADYSQIELRIVAAMANDTTMIEAFKNNKDIHAATAAKVYNIAEADVTKDQRRNAKAVNFGIIYGQSAFGLAENLGISRTEAKEIIDNYWREFSSIKSFLTTQVDIAKDKGYAETLMGRKRWLKDLYSANAVVRGFAERNAINMPVQGSAADMIKMAMIKIHAAMKTQNLKSKMLLQVHDELVFDAHKSEIDILKNMLHDLMPNAMQLPNETPVAIEIGVGDNWLEAH